MMFYYFIKTGKIIAESITGEALARDGRFKCQQEYVAVISELTTVINYEKGRQTEGDDKNRYKISMSFVKYQMESFSYQTLRE